MEWLTENLNMWVGGGTSAVVLWVLKSIPNESIYNTVNKLCYTAGVTMTLGLSKFRFTKGIWNKTIEPYFIDLINNTIGAAVNGLIKGLKSDNK